MPQKGMSLNKVISMAGWSLLSFSRDQIVEFAGQFMVFILQTFSLQAEACRSVGYAMKKCPNGFYAEIKYDGERVQLHKKGSHFQYFSRSLKPVLPHKVTISHILTKSP